MPANATPVVASPAAPVDYPPPFDARDYVTRPGGPPELRIDVGVAIVGAGPAGLACAVRLGQLLADDPALAETLGDVPVAVLEKGKAPGSHALSGAIVNPSALRDLFPQTPLESIPNFGPVRGESVYLLRGRGAQWIPTPPPFHNKGNWIFSLSQLTRWLAEQAETLGVMVLPETPALRLLVADGQVHGVQTAPLGLGRDGEKRPSSAPPTEVLARATVLAEGTQGHLRGVALDYFGVTARFPQIYALGVKEVWKVPAPLTRVIHTLGWPLRGAARYGEVGGSFVYPMGNEHLCIGFVCGLEYADQNLSPHDLLQQLKTHPSMRRLLHGGERVAWGAKTIPEGGWFSVPETVSLPGAVLTGDSAGFVNVPKLKGVHYAMRSGMLAAEAIVAALKRGDDPRSAGALDGYDSAVRKSQIRRDLYRVRNMRQALSHGLVSGGSYAGLMDATRGVFPGGAWGHHADADVAMRDYGREPVAADGVTTFDKLSSVFLSGNRTRDDQPNHIRIAGRVPIEIARTWVNLCPAAVYEIVEGSETQDGLVRVAVAASNCVQCGAITGKGGRLTPPEGGSGPEYTQM
jgi:electron-transferring-flavoprotein dehydrogenase